MINEKYYVYTILSLKDFDIYTGITTDLRTRIQEHMRGVVGYTKIRIPFKLVHYEYFVNLEDARRREMYLKTNIGRARLKDSLKKTLARKTYMPYRLVK
jgi:putative endonuclease